jgi:hypothetical protein
MAELNDTKDDREVLLLLFQAYLEDMGRIGARHETLRQFYVSLVSALFVFLAMAGKDGLFQEVRGAVLIMATAVGIFICVSWLLHMGSLASLFRAKRATLSEIEKQFPFQLFASEDIELKNARRLRLTTVDRIVAAGFVLMFFTMLFLKLE